jgi:hypothetical protein
MSDVDTDWTLVIGGVDGPWPEDEVPGADKCRLADRLLGLSKVEDELLGPEDSDVHSHADA